MTDDKIAGYQLRHTQRGEQVDPTSWGDWKLDRERLVLTNESEDYEIDLEQCKSAGATLDWIIQISSKTWGTAECVGSLVAALRDLLDPQTTLTHGEDIAGEDVRALVARREIDALVDREIEAARQAAREDSDDEGFEVISFGDLSREYDERASAYEVVGPEPDA